MSTSDSWCSPPEIADPLEQFFRGPVDIDPCSNDRSIIRARQSFTTGGLLLPWRLAKPVDRTAYQNDPYSKAEAWTAKMLRELGNGNVREHVRLCMMSTSSRWWASQCMDTRRNPRILALKRIPFLDYLTVAERAQLQGLRPSKKKGSKRGRQVCRFEPALLYWGPSPGRFVKEFSHITRWITWGR